MNSAKRMKCRRQRQVRFCQWMDLLMLAQAIDSMGGVVSSQGARVLRHTAYRRRTYTVQNQAKNRGTQPTAQLPEPWAVGGLALAWPVPACALRLCLPACLT